MKYTEKIKYAEIVSEKLLNEQSLEQVKQYLKEDGLYEYDINNVIASARNVINEKYKPLIRAKLLARESLKNVKELEKLDLITLDKLVKQEVRAISAGERKKVNELIQNGYAPEKIFSEIRLDFYPKEYIALQIATYNEVKKQNSGSARMLNIIGGIALMVLGGVISYATMQGNGGGGRLFYGLIVVGFIMMIKGFLTVENPY
jgi:hypothetical protein